LDDAYTTLSSLLVVVVVVAVVVVAVVVVRVLLLRPWQNQPRAWRRAAGEGHPLSPLQAARTQRER
jgi:hypothetical protein